MCRANGSPVETNTFGEQVWMMLMVAHLHIGQPIVLCQDGNHEGSGMPHWKS